MRKLTIFILLSALFAVSLKAGTITPNLKSAASFAVLAATTVTNTGATVVTGDLGLYPGKPAAVTGFNPPGIVNGTIHAGDTFAQQAQVDLTDAYTTAAGQGFTSDLSGKILGVDPLANNLAPGVYFFSSSAQLNGILNLNGNAAGVWIFQIGSALTTASASSVVLTGGGVGDNVFWQVGSSATLGTTTEFQGNILALTSISLKTGANIQCGRALAQNGAVTMEANRVSIPAGPCQSGTSAPEIGTLSLLSLSLGCCGIAFLRSKSR